MISVLTGFYFKLRESLKGNDFSPWQVELEQTWNRNRICHIKNDLSLRPSWSRLCQCNIIHGCCLYYNTSRAAGDFIRVQKPNLYIQQWFPKKTVTHNYPELFIERNFSTLDLLNQHFLGWVSEICVFLKLWSNPEMQPDLRTHWYKTGKAWRHSLLVHSFVHYFNRHSTICQTPIQALWKEKWEQEKLLRLLEPNEDCGQRYR